MKKFRDLLSWPMKSALIMIFFTKSNMPEVNDTSDVGGSKILYLILPWLNTTIPFFSIAQGLVASMRGNDVEFVYDNTLFGNDRFAQRWIVFWLNIVMLLVSTRYVVHRPESLPAVLDDEGSNDLAAFDLDQAVDNNVKWELKGEQQDPRRQSFEHIVRRDLELAVHRIGRFTVPPGFNLAILPGGVWGFSGVWLQHLKNSSVRVATYDSGGYGTAMWSVDGIAAQLTDVPKAVDDISKSSGFDFSLIQSLVDSEIDDRRRGIDRFESQHKQTTDACFKKGAYLIALNSSWDSAALGLHSIFKSGYDWITWTTAFLLENTDHDIIIRQHPAERFKIAGSNDTYQELVDANFPNNPRVKFINCYDPINSYQIFDHCGLVIVYTSTIAIEAAIFGKNTVSVSSNYYSEASFLNVCSNIDDYKEALIPSANRVKFDRDQAYLYYYATQICNWVYTDFNPMDFFKWVSKNPKSLADDDTISMQHECLEDGTPIAVASHLKIQKREGS